MINFIRKLERLFLNLLIITLIVIISLQIIMKNEKAYQRLKEIEFSIKNVFQEQQVIKVANFNEIEAQGIIVIDLLQNYSLPQVWLVKNGQRVGNFTEGNVKTTVLEGDLLVLDCRFHNEPLWFEITKLSSDIRTWHTGQQFRIYAEEKRIGVVQFYDKL